MKRESNIRTKMTAAQRRAYYEKRARQQPATATPDLIAACHVYLDAHAKEARAIAAEDRAFARYMNDPTTNTAGSARSTRSRTNAANHVRIAAETPVEQYMRDWPVDLTPAGIAVSQWDIFAFAMAITAKAQS